MSIRDAGPDGPLASSFTAVKMSHRCIHSNKRYLKLANMYMDPHLLVIARYACPVCPAAIPLLDQVSAFSSNRASRCMPAQACFHSCPKPSTRSPEAIRSSNLHTQDANAARLRYIRTSAVESEACPARIRNFCNRNNTPHHTRMSSHAGAERVVTRASVALCGE
ncbi:hypothetical protein C8Q80DRAFT_445654 [Daedaleopsis nitida]|nr:hypothetical protein C8Q80DRAFT_445654 [Daedaleopsis nitida]